MVQKGKYKLFQSSHPSQHKQLSPKFIRRTSPQRSEPTIIHNGITIAKRHSKKLHKYDNQHKLSIES